MAHNWWAIQIRGVLAVLFGVVAFLVPGLTLTFLAYLFAIYLLGDGVFALIAGMRALERGQRWGALALEGLLGILLGAMIILWPGASIVVLVQLIGAWAILTGILAIATAVRMHRHHGEWLIGLAGAVSILLGIGLLFEPVLGAVAIAYWLGAYAIIFGVALIILGIRLRTRHNTGPITL